MKNLFTLLTMLISLNAFADHGVGNGGDNRELSLYEKLSKLNSFLKTPQGAHVFADNPLTLDTFQRVSDAIYFRITKNASSCMIIAEHAHTGKRIIYIKDSAECLDRYLAAPLALQTDLLTSISALITTLYSEINIDLNEIRKSLTENDAALIEQQKSAFYHRTCDVFYPGKINSEETFEFLQKVFKTKGYVFKKIPLEIGSDYFLIQTTSPNLLLNCSYVENFSTCASLSSKPIGKSQDLLVKIANNALKLPSCIRKEAIYD